MYMGHSCMGVQDLGYSACHCDVWCPGWRLCFPGCVEWEHPTCLADTGGTSPAVRCLLLGAAGHKQGSKISLERDLSTCAAGLCLIKSSWKRAPELAVAEQGPQQSGTSITVTALAFPFVTLYSFIVFVTCSSVGPLAFRTEKQYYFSTEKWLYCSGIFVCAYQVCWDTRFLFSPLLWKWGELILLTRSAWWSCENC